MTIFGIIAGAEKGGNFLDWTLHFLSGKNDYYNYQTNSVQSCITDPLTNHNSHAHRSNHPRTIKELEDCLYSLKTIKPHKFHSIYLHQVASDDLSNNLNEEKNIQAVNVLQNAADKLVVVKTSPETRLYTCKAEKRFEGIRSANGKDIFDTYDEYLDNFLETYFKESLDKYFSQNLTNIWDKRELLALNIIPFESFDLADYVNKDKKSFTIVTQDYWLTFDKCVQNMFEYLGLEMSKQRWAHWLDIYSKWKTIHYDRLRFCWYFNEIIDSIIEGRYLDLTQFNLDIVREASIQHTIIYKHNLNFKTWQLKKFNNTLQLHNLLEQNTHTGNILNSTQG